MKLKCECGRIGTWYYMGGEEIWVCCNDCVPRGCSCFQWTIENERCGDYYPLGIEGKDWQWIKKDIQWEELDGKGNRLPCIEWEYDKEGWDE